MSSPSTQSFFEVSSSPKEGRTILGHRIFPLDNDEGLSTIPEGRESYDKVLFQDANVSRPLELRLERSSPLTPTTEGLESLDLEASLAPSTWKSSPVEHLAKEAADDIAFGEDKLQPMDSERVVALRRWIFCIAIVNFDLDVGPMISKMYPDVGEIGGPERENIAFSSFPDGLLFDTGVQNHSFRVRHNPVSEAKSTLAGNGFLYGYSIFVQKRDPSIKRGYLQRSVVILSQHPFPSLFTLAVTKAGTFYFSHGITMIETACHNIASWPDPTPGAALELGLLGSVIHAEIPRHQDEHQSMLTSSFGEKFNANLHILASLPPPSPSIVTLLASCLTKIWSLWECVVLSEPLLIFAPSPSQTSVLIWWLRDFLRPIPLAGDFRPYFHIHDRDYGQFINKNPPKAGVILGVTNPFFANLCGHWPHVLCLKRDDSALKTQTMPSVAPYMGPPPGFQTKHKRYISKDRGLLKRLEDIVAKGGATELEACNLLRQHFMDRTQKLLVPLNRHLQSLIPVNPKGPIKPFTPTSFRESLKAHGSLLPFKSSAKQKDFYDRWLKTPAFGMWLTTRVEEVQNVLDKRLLETSNLTP